ncbi:hypothetical protein BS78_03G398100 [Paspalum vaginatum]|nr:hypothetical protein BS78_03G398100 [Paspalum vaginatum]
MPMDDGFAALPEHLLYEVLSRVGNVKDLFMFAVTCRRWLRRFTDPAFLRRLCPGHAARLLGFLSQKTEHGTTVLAPAFFPAPGSPLGPTSRALTSFVAAADGNTFSDAKPLAARRGIVLMMQLGPRTSERTSTSLLLLGLCNPITGERHALPPLEWRCGRDAPSYDVMLGCAIITAADSDDGIDLKQPPPSSSSSGRRFTFSQLLLIVENGGELCIHSYSAATCSWSMPVDICLDIRQPRISLAGVVGNFDARSAVVHRGAARWLCVNDTGGDDSLYKLSVKAGTTSVSLAKLPVRGGGKPFLCVTREGKLAVVSVHTSYVTVWTRQGGDDTPAAWPCTAAFIVPAVAPYPYLPLSSYEWFDFSRGAMLLVHKQTGIVFILDLEKKVMEKVMDCPLLPRNLVHQTPVPYEMDLVDFFGLCRGPRKYYLRCRRPLQIKKE